MIWGLLSGLGLGEQLFAAAVLAAAAWYGLRALSLAGTAGTVVSSWIMQGVITAVVLAVALALGWLDPQIGAISRHISTFEQFLRGVVVDAIRGLVEGGL